jgi:hypothetical protein
MILASVLGPCGVTFWIVFRKRQHLFAYSFAGPFWSGSGACFGLQTMILGSVLGGFWVGLGPGKSCQSVQLYAFSGFGLFWSGVCFRIRFWKGSGMHLGRFGYRLGTHWEPLGLCFSVWRLPLWHVDFLCFLECFRDLSKSRAGQKFKVITLFLGPKTAIQQTSRLTTERIN